MPSMDKSHPMDVTNVVKPEDPGPKEQPEFEAGPITHIRCGPNAGGHQCDSLGPEVYGLNDGNETFSRKEAEDRGFAWMSVTCSTCGKTALENSFWMDP